MANTNMVLCVELPGFSNDLKYVECTECETRYPMSSGGRLMCNSQLYEDCPYCRPRFDEKHREDNEELAKGAVF